ncbi:MAG: hypothetical protein JWR02_221 [Mucilaginibacter sp.]|nr:hypothetical protein [Mucilaginibacter sp.]
MAIPTQPNVLIMVYFLALISSYWQISFFAPVEDFLGYTKVIKKIFVTIR